MPRFFDLPTWKGFAFLRINALKYRESLVDSLPKGIGDRVANGTDPTRVERVPRGLTAERHW